MLPLDYSPGLKISIKRIQLLAKSVCVGGGGGGGLAQRAKCTNIIGR